MAATFSDINRRVGLVERPALLADEDAVLNAIYNILGTEQGERVFLPEFGSSLNQFLQEPMDAQTAHNLRYAIIRAVERWEPRVEIISRLTKVVPLYDEQVYDVKLAVRIIGLSNDTEYRLYLKAPDFSGFVS